MNIGRGTPLDKPSLFHSLVLAATGAGLFVWVFTVPDSGGIAVLFGMSAAFYVAVSVATLGLLIDSPPDGAVRAVLFLGVLAGPWMGAYSVLHSPLAPSQKLGAWLAMAMIEAGLIWPSLQPLLKSAAKLFRRGPAAGPLPSFKHDTAIPEPELPPADSQVVDKPQLVASGSFKIDRAKALEKLQQFQLEDPDAFLLPWIRCAVSAGARNIQLKSVGLEGVEMSFDGTPFSRRELEGPYEGLFAAEGEASERLRHFSVGLLGALRTGPAQIAVFSGHGRDAARLLINDPQSRLRDPESTQIWANTLRVIWSGLSGWSRAKACLERAQDGFGPCPAKLSIDGHVISPLPKENGKTIFHFGKGKRQGCVMAAWEDGARAGRVRLYKQGALAAEIRVPSLRGGACLSDDELTLNISQSGVVKNKRLEEDLELIRAADWRLPEPSEAVSRGMRPSDWVGAALFAAGVGLAWLLIF